jgi:hypothetical protein
MKTKDCGTYWANIYVGFREGYDGKIHTIEEAKDIVQKYCDDKSYCVTITPTTFVYKKGREDGCVIGLINYPRFPESIHNILKRAEILAEIFLKEFNQFKISVVSPVHTFMIEKDE